MKQSNSIFYEWLAPWYEQVYEGLDKPQTVRQWNALLRDVAPDLCDSAPTQPPRLLDAGCGPGWHAVEWCRAGFAVTGVDISGSMLRLAATRIKEAGDLVIDLEQADLRTWRTNSKFDLIVNHTYFTHLFALDELLQVAQALRRAARPGCVWLQQYADLSQLAIEGRRKVISGPLAGMTVEARRHRKAGIYEQNWTYRGESRTEVFWEHSFSALQQLFSQAGWGHAELFASGLSHCWEKRQTINGQAVLVVRRS